jgi:hypothetical protein
MVMDWQNAVAYLTMFGLPAALATHQALRSRLGPDGSLEWAFPGQAVMALTAYGLTLLLATALAATGETGGLEGVVERMLGTLLEAQREVPELASDRAQILAQETALAAIAPWLPAITFGLVLIIMAGNAALAQGLLMRFERNRRPPMRVSTVDLPHWAPLALAAVGLLAVVAPDPVGYVAMNAMGLLLVPFFFAGLAVVHALVEGRSARWPVLVGFYVVLLLSGGVVPLVIIGMGVIEQWVGLRRRIARPGPDRENKSWK